MVATGVAVLLEPLPTEGNRFFEIPIVDALGPNENGLLEGLVIAVETVAAAATVGLLKLKPPLPKPDELVEATRFDVNAEDDGVAVTLFDTAEVETTVDVLTPKRGTAELEEGGEVNDKLVGNLKLLETVLGESSFFIGGKAKVVLLGILKALADTVVVDAGEGALGIAVNDGVETRSNLKPPTLGGDVVEEVATNSLEFVVAGEDFPNENVGVASAEEIADEVSLVGRGREVVTGDGTALIVVVVVLISPKAGGFVVIVGV